MSCSLKSVATLLAILTTPSFASAGSPATGGSEAPRAADQLHYVRDEPANFGIVAGPGTKFSTLGFTKLVVIPGGSGGVLLFKRLLLQGTNYALPAVQDPHDSARKLTLSWFGGTVGWVFAPASTVHLLAGTLVGSALATVSGGGGADAELSYLALEPFADAEVNFYKGLRLYVGGAYRVMLGKDRSASVDASLLSGPAIEIGFRMGGF